MNYVIIDDRIIEGQKNCICCLAAPMNTGYLAVVSLLRNYKLSWFVGGMKVDYILVSAGFEAGVNLLTHLSKKFK